MPRQILVHLFPGAFEPDELRGGAAVVIDVLRATSTIVHALAAGATSVVPCGEIEEARRIAAQCPVGTYLLGGERGGRKIKGFDLGNSPSEYVRTVVSGKKVIFTTTNGTQALIRAKEARRVLVGAMSNLGAVVEHLANESGPVHLVCSGTERRVTLEDVLCAGAIAHWLELADERADTDDDATQLAVGLYQSCGHDYDRGHTDCILALLRKSQIGRAHV